MIYTIITHLGIQYYVFEYLFTFVILSEEIFHHPNRNPLIPNILLFLLSHLSSQILK